MGKTILFHQDYNSVNVEGRAEFSDGQLNSTITSSSIRLRRNLIYVVPKQFVHKERLTIPINGHTHSKRVFVVGVDPVIGEPVEGLTISINTLRQTHFGKLIDNPSLKIVASNDNVDQVWRAKDAPVFSVFRDTPAPIMINYQHGYVSREFAFRVTDRYKVYTAQFNPPRKVDGREVYDMSTIEIDGKRYLNLGIPTVNEFQILDETPIYYWDKYIPELAEFQKDLPE